MKNNLFEHGLGTQRDRTQTDDHTKLNVDTLPAPVISLFETLVAHCRQKSKTTRFSAIVNCGFPEAYQNANAIAVCAEFARSAGFEWMGGLPLGEGEGMVRAQPLQQLGGQGTSLRQALERAVR